MGGTQQYTKVIETKIVPTVPSSDDLEIINTMALRPLSADEVYVRSEYLCNNQVDRTFEWFPPEALQQISDTIVGKAMLAGHDTTSLPLGRYYKSHLEAKTAQDGREIIYVRPSFYMAITDANEHARKQIDAGVWTYKSVGFYAEDIICDICQMSIRNWECPHFPGKEYLIEDKKVVCTAHFAGKIEAVEGSVVYLGCQYDARILKQAADIEERHKEHLFSLKQKPVKKRINIEQNDAITYKGAIPYQRTPLAKEDYEWDASAEVAAATVDDLRVMCAWYDEKNPDAKASYKLPHHTAKEHLCVWRGVAASMAALMGARGGVNIPQKDRTAVLHHIERHYEDFNKESPTRRGESVFRLPEEELKGIEFHEIEWHAGEKNIFEEVQFESNLHNIKTITSRFIKSGRVLSAANLALVEAAIAALTALRDAALGATGESESADQRASIEDVIIRVLNDAPITITGS